MFAKQAKLLQYFAVCILGLIVRNVDNVFRSIECQCVLSVFNKHLALNSGQRIKKYKRNVEAIY